MAFRPFQSLKECGHKFGTICPEVRRGTWAFIYALSADETSPLFSASPPQTKPCFPAASNVLAFPGGNLIFAATPTERITHYTLQAKSCAKWGRCPLWKPPQEKAIRYPSTGRISPFLVIQPSGCIYRAKASGVVVGIFNCGKLRIPTC